MGCLDPADRAYVPDWRPLADDARRKLKSLGYVDLVPWGEEPQAAFSQPPPQPSPLSPFGPGAGEFRDLVVLPAAGRLPGHAAWRTLEWAGGKSVQDAGIAESILASSPIRLQFHERPGRVTTTEGKFHPSPCPWAPHPRPDDEPQLETPVRPGGGTENPSNGPCDAPEIILVEVGRFRLLKLPGWASPTFQVAMLTLASRSMFYAQKNGHVGKRSPHEYRVEM